ncbi:hypothetical protein X975_18329, partial [Stegodyphus mimosarum]
MPFFFSNKYYTCQKVVVTKHWNSFSARIRTGKGDRYRFTDKKCPSYFESLGR